MKKLFLLLGIAAVLLIAPLANADVIYDEDPANLHIGNPPNTGNYLYQNQEVRPISSTSLGISDQAGDKNFSNPLLLILGIPNKNSSVQLPGLTWTNTANGHTGNDNPGGAVSPIVLLPGGNGWNASTGYAGNLNPGGEVYSEIGLKHDANSNSFGNWSAADLYANKISANTFALYVYELTNTGFNGSLLDISFSKPLPGGTFAVAYDQYRYYDKNNLRILPYNTPFTESGLTPKKRPNAVPEPSTIFLLGIGLLGLGFYGRKRLKI